ncbi:MAG: hypothetical protein VXX96_05000 [Bacteroidota bacterium]|nr:hypothetical protein [Bacteroidota bacterium]MEC8602537.1 hypothetical protein [Bacteroidota bacterium]
MRILLFISLVVISSCKDDNRQTFFSGKILNKSSEKIILSFDENPLYSSIISESGNFSITIDSLESGLHNFFLQPEFQYVILEEGDSIYIRLNSLDFDESLVFMGKGSAKNNFLIDVFLKNEIHNEILNTYYNTSFDNFLIKVDSLLNNQNELFKEFKQNNQLSKLSENLIFDAIKYPLLEKIQSYLVSNNIDINRSEIDYSKYEIDFNNNSISSYKPYIDFIYLYSFNLTKSRSNHNFQVDRLKILDSLVQSDNIKSKLFRFLAFEILLNEKSLKEKRIFFEEFKNISDYNYINNEVEILLENQSQLSPGNSFPSIKGYDLNGNIKDISTIYNKKIIFFWSYDQNAHLNSIYQKINFLENKYLSYKLISLNINDDIDKWKSNYKPTNNVTELQTNDFEYMSKKLILDNLNKVFIVDENNIIQAIGSINDFIRN